METGTYKNMKTKTYYLQLTDAQVEQLLFCVEYVEREGVGYRPLNHFDKRTKEIKKAISHSMHYNGLIDSKRYNEINNE